MRKPTTKQRSEKGIALVIALFCILLLSGISLGMILSSGTEKVMSANYRGSTQGFYASLAGLEESRGRFWTSHPSHYNSLFIGSSLTPDQVRYILNPATGETVAPTTASNAYYDKWYYNESGTQASGVLAANVKTTTSVSKCAGCTANCTNCSSGIPGPLFKWVRITANTEKLSGVDVNGDGTLDSSTQLYYDGTNQNLTSTGQPVYRITSLAVLPSGATRLLLYEVAGLQLTPVFPAAITLDGPTPTDASGSSPAAFPNSGAWSGSGNDAFTGGCSGSAQAAKPAVATVDGSTLNIPKPGDLSGTSPPVQNVSGSMPAPLATVASLDQLATTVTANATAVVNDSGGGCPADMVWGTATAPTVTVVNGDLSCTGNAAGYGILLVTGSLHFGGKVSWNGVVLVIGQGVFSEGGGGNGNYNGAVLVAKTRNPSGTLLSTLGSPSFDWSGGGTNKVAYDSCQISKANGATTYKVLAFREIPQ